MVDHTASLSMRVIDINDSVICVARHQVFELTPEKVPLVQQSDSELPYTTITGNGHLGGLGGVDATATVGHNIGFVLSTGYINSGGTFLIGLKATQLVAQGSGFQLNLTESLQAGPGWMGAPDGPSGHARAAIYLSAHRELGLNTGIHFETSRSGGLVPSFMLGIGGFFDKKYD
jgi:hypothetical protein